MKAYVAALMCSLLIAPTLVGAEPKRHQEEKDRGEIHFQRLQKEMGLTPEQAKKLQEHRKAHRAKEQELRRKIQEKRRLLHAELEKADLDLNRINVLRDEVKTLQNEQADHRVAAILEVREILGPERFKKFKEKMRGKRMGKNRGWGDK